MQRSNIIKQTLVFFACGAWLFFLLSLASFHVTDWPSHAIYPWPPIQNLCGSAGAWCAYNAFLELGQGAFLILFFTGVCLAIVLFNNRVGDLWLRTIGLLILSIAFAAAVHHFRPGSGSSFPEGYGGILGIGASSFLQTHFNTVGTRLILLTCVLIGLLLTADDLVLRAPGMVGGAISEVKQRTPQINFRFPAIPKLPSRPGVVTRDALIKPRPSAGDDDDELLKPPVLLPRGKNANEDQVIDLVRPKDDAELQPPKPPAPAQVRKDIVVRLPNSIKPRQTSPPPPKELAEYHLPDWDCLGNAE